MKVSKEKQEVFNKSVAVVMAKLIEENNMTATEVAKAADLNRITIWRILKRDAYGYSPLILREILAALPKSVSLGDFYQTVDNLFKKWESAQLGDEKL